MIVAGGRRRRGRGRGGGARPGPARHPGRQRPAGQHRHGDQADPGRLPQPRRCARVRSEHRAVQPDHRYGDRAARTGTGGQPRRDAVPGRRRASGAVLRQSARRTALCPQGTTVPTCARSRRTWPRSATPGSLWTIRSRRARPPRCGRGRRRSGWSRPVRSSWAGSSSGPRPSGSTASTPGSARRPIRADGAAHQRHHPRRLGQGRPGRPGPVATGTAATIVLPDGQRVAATVTEVVDGHRGRPGRRTARPRRSRRCSHRPTSPPSTGSARSRSTSCSPRAERKDVLTVPVAALVVLREGGYGVEVVDGGTSRYVAVKTGLFADGRVEVTGDRDRRGHHGRDAGMIELTDVTKRYPGGVTALDRVSRAHRGRRAGRRSSGRRDRASRRMLHLIGTLDRPSDRQRPHRRARGGAAVRPAAVRAAGAPDRVRVPAVPPRRRGVRLWTTWPTACSTPACALGDRRERAEEALTRVGLGHRMRPPTARAVRRGAAAGGDRPGGGRRAGRGAGRRADRQPRLGLRRRR